MRTTIGLTILCLSITLPVAAQRGRATRAIQATVTNHSGLPIEGVRVTLSGSVSRDGFTDSYGRVLFEALPDGRYDVIAWPDGISNSIPVVVDLSAQSGPIQQLEVVIKPRRLVGGLPACTMGPPALKTLKEFLEDADAAAHIKVERHWTYEEGSPPGSEPAFIWTVLDVHVLELFQASGPLHGGILQYGGVIDRGDYLDMTHSDLQPLNVGDEYVVFLKNYDEWPLPRIHFNREGTFRIRNGAVEPVGSGDLARSWRARRADEFLQVLRNLRDSRLPRGYPQ